MYSREKSSDTMRRPGGDGKEPDRLQGAEDQPKDLREANDNIRQAQGDDQETHITTNNNKSGNRPRFDRDR